MDPSPTRGIVYVATKKNRYVAEAFLSAISVKELVPDLPITLFTNLTNSAFARDDCFDSVVPIDTVREYGKSWSEGQLDRIKCLPRSPYEQTLHLDSDTRVRSAEIGGVFSVLEEHDIAMVECLPDNSYSCEKFGRPMFNVGFILYRKSDKVLNLLAEWDRLTSEHFALARDSSDPNAEWLSHVEDAEIRRKLLLMDQLSMVRLLSPEVNRFGLDCKILEHSWNYRGSRIQPVPDFPVRVDHHPHLRSVYFKRDIARAGASYVQAGNVDRALEIFEAALEQWPGDMDFLKCIVLSHLKRDALDEADRWLDVLLGHFPGHPWAMNGKHAIAEKISAKRQ